MGSEQFDDFTVLQTTSWKKAVLVRKIGSCLKRVSAKSVIKCANGQMGQSTDKRRRSTDKRSSPDKQRPTDEIRSTDALSSTDELGLRNEWSRESWNEHRVELRKKRVQGSE